MQVLQFQGDGRYVIYKVLFCKIKLFVVHSRNLLENFVLQMHRNVNTTHRDPKYFPDPEKFNPSRFEGKGPQPFTFVPFGGGPRMCPGREYARAQVLAFIHNVVTRFKWEKVDPCEKVAYNPSPIPSKGFPIRLQPLQNGFI